METNPTYQKAKYFTSAAEIKQLPADEGWEVAFIGRSNAGKSSSINTITGIKGLARTSNTPGRTQMINFFSLDDHRRLVDLPGYGYAKVPRVIQDRWINTTNEYLQTRKCLRGLVLIMDIRHPLKEMDQKLISWALQCEVPLHILLTKADKITPNASRKIFKEVQEALQPYQEHLTIQTFSSLQKTGLEEVQQKLDRWFEFIK